ncbi:MAG: DUF5659 domain-containing protein [Cetobacterium sp.]
MRYDCEVKVIFSKSRAMDLISMGNRLLRMEDDKINIGRFVFLFENTNKLREDICTLAEKHQ